MQHRRSICLASALIWAACGDVPNADTDAGPRCELGSPTDCAACGDACGADTPFCDATAEGFACVGTCSQASTDVCEGRCVSLDNNPRHCGECNNLCDFDNGASVCDSGVCVLAACTSGFGDCNDADSDGCETELTSQTNCGGCGSVCAGEDRCSDGACAPCPRTSPALAGLLDVPANKSQTEALCAIVGNGNTLRLFADQRDENGLAQCVEKTTITAFDLTFSGATTIVSDAGLCGFTANGNTIAFKRYGDDGSGLGGFDGCLIDAGAITVTGATVNGSMDVGINTICRVEGDANTLRFGIPGIDIFGELACVANNAVSFASVCNDS